MATPFPFPELIFGVAGPIGVNVDAIAESIAAALKDVGYSSEPIKLTRAMQAYPTKTDPVDEEDFSELMNYKMTYADNLCIENSDLAIMARIAIKAIREARRKKTNDFDTPVEKYAYIIRQFKRPEEIQLMRSVYGKQFVLVSAYGSFSNRYDILLERQKKSSSTLKKGGEHASAVDKLIERDESESSMFGGQQLRDTFHLADVFIDGIHKQEMDSKLVRFCRAFFGINTAAPTKDEYGMYAAKSASIRSCDLSRQTGAAVFTSDGELIVQGCNEVPKALGGTYWDLEEPDFRDVKMGSDPNDEIKKDVIRNLVERLWAHDFLSEKAMAFKTANKLTDELIRKAKDEKNNGALVGSTIMDLTEFGRVVHAEMCALCDAARNGRSVKGATMYATTFPCHNCTKHIIASGIKRVVYMEPYPKSRAKQLHPNEIAVEEDADKKVSFIPFIGISPLRYRDIFLKEAKRKRSDGTARVWYSIADEPVPMVNVLFNAHPDLEETALTEFLGKFGKEDGFASSEVKAEQ